MCPSPEACRNGHDFGAFAGGRKKKKKKRGGTPVPELSYTTAGTRRRADRVSRLSHSLGVCDERAGSLGGSLTHDFTGTPREMIERPGSSQTARYDSLRLATRPAFAKK